LTRHGRLGVIALAMLASLIFVTSAFAGGNNQLVQKSGTTVTWTGGTNNSPVLDDDSITVTETGGSEITIHSLSGPIDLFDDSPDGATATDCAYDDGPDTSTVICGNTSAFTANAEDGSDTVDAGGLTSIAATLNGDGGVDSTPGADTLTGGGGDDTINGGDENDVLSGNGGRDTIDGGDGDDQIEGGAGDDSPYFCCTAAGLHGGSGDDTITGGPGIDALFGDDGADTMDGGDDIDHLEGGPDNDTMNGGPGDDQTTNVCFVLNFGATGICCTGSEADGCGMTIPGGIFGGPGDDTIHGGDGADNIAGNNNKSNNVLLVSQSDDDTLYGDAGNDTIRGQGGDDFIDAGEGDDGHPGGTQATGGSGTEVSGGTGDDVVNGGPGNDYAYGGPGADTVNGDAGDDYLDAACDGGCDTSNDGNDSVNGGDGNDYVSGNDGNDTLTGGDGSDEVYGEDGNDSVDGGSGDDYLEGSWGDDSLQGGDGSDELVSGYGADTSDGGAGDDNIEEFDDAAVDTVHGGTGIDELTYNACCTPVTITLDDQADDGRPQNPDAKDAGDPGNNFGSDLDNVIYHDTSCNTFCEESITDNPVTIVGTAGANLLYGSNGGDDITGGAGADYMSGGNGGDTFHARDGYPDYVDCDDGVDTAIVDQFDTVHNCENVDEADVPSAFDTSKPPPVPPTPPATGAGNNPPDLLPPVLTLDVPKTTFTANQLVLGVKVTFSCSEDCSLSLRLLAQQAPGSATFSRVKGYNVVVGRKTVGFGKSKRGAVVRPCERKPGGPQSKACLKRFKKALNHRLAKTGKVTMKLIAVTEDRAGNRTQRTKTITIRGKKK
jgi:Ca2+-binding RTX toxin-like protein